MSAFRITTARELGLAIRGRRKALAMDQRTLASKVGVSRQWVSELEHGKPRAEIALILRTLRALDLQVWVGTEPPVPPRRARGNADVDLDALVDGMQGSK
jgi:HTH-type transcriptional regulator/antitoxin HipB